MDLQNSTEFWKPVPTYEGHYEVSSIGRIRGLRHNQGPRKLPRLLNARKHLGYPVVNLSRNGILTTFFIHRLVLFAHRGPPPPRCICRHLNDVKTDNRLENLVWGSCQENYKDRVRNFGPVIHPDRKGEKNARAKLTKRDVLEIRALAKGGWLQTEIAERFGISQPHTSHIIIRRVWKHVE